MLFSVIIPTCKRNDLLSKCLKLLTPGLQTIDPNLYEVIVTDDSIGNEAKGIIEQQFGWVRWVAGPKDGPAANRNNGADCSTGEWLLFTDDDCLPTYEWIESFNAAIKKYNSIKVFEGKTLSTRPFFHALETAPVNNFGGYLWSCNFCIERRFFLEIGGFDKIFKYPHLEDNDLRLRILQENNVIKFIPDALVYHPPRTVGSGRKLGYYHKYDVYFYEKHKIKYSYLSITKNVLLIRIKTILNRKFSKYSLLGIWYLTQELLIITTKYIQWKNFTGKILSKK